MPATQMEAAGTAHTVHIRFGEGGFHYIQANGQPAAKITVRKGDHVKWHCEHGNYSILFKQKSPFGEIAFHGRGGEETGTAVVTGGKGSYHYGVTVSLEHGMQVDDPEIIVDDTGN